MPRADTAPTNSAEAGAGGTHLVPDLINASIPAGGRVVVVSDLHLGQNATPSSEQAVADLARVLDRWSGPGLVVLAGDVFELLAEPHRDPGRAIAAHSRLATALRAFTSESERQVVALAGNHDGALAWHRPAVKALEAVGAQVALALEVTAETGSGPRKVRIEHGHQLDPANRFDDPRNPAETPLGHHVVQDLLPIAKRPGADWLNGINQLSDPAEAAAFVASRLLYRRVSRTLGLLLIPFGVAIAVALVQAGARLSGRSSLAVTLRPYTLTFLFAGVGLLLAVGFGTVFWAVSLRRPLAVFEGGDLSGGAEPSNDAPRSMARKLVGDGYAGLITGHTHEPELVDLGDGFYANTGCGGAVVERREGRFGLPPAFALARHMSWVELEAGSDLHTRLVHARQDLPTTTTLERLATRPLKGGTARPEVVAKWPGGDSWPPMVDEGPPKRQARRGAAFAIAFAGLVDVVFAVVPPSRHRLRALSNLVPLALSQTAAVLVALIGIALLLLARGVRRGQRHAWAASVLLLTSSAVLHLVKGLNVAEGTLAALIVVYLLAKRRFFKVKEDLGGTRRSIVAIVGAALVALGTATAVIELFPGRHVRRLPLGRAMSAAAERMVGISSVPLADRVDDFLSPVLLAVAIGLAVALLWSIFQPVRASRLSARPPEAEEQARRLVAEYGGDTLSYFALRDDKRWFFHGDTVIAYAIHQGVCLVSPDPIGPVVERRGAWAAFRRFADDHGWPVAVMGASEEWLPIYRAAGMRDLYVGDEAVVDVRRFSLEGGRNKGLRQAVNRIAKYGYRIEFHDPAHLDPALEAQLRDLMGESRRGEVERGFSMTLSRVFDSHDEGLLLAVCFGPDGKPAAFCHFVPALAIRGYSLDLMRRSEGEHPNGLTDFVVVRTIEHLRDTGHIGLGLNFAVMRSVLAGERGDRLTTRIQRWMLMKMSDSMQIESLWKFNAKFDPDWVPRYAVYDSAEHMIASAVAVARAESFWELPIIGRFFKPKAPGSVDAPALPGLPVRGTDSASASERVEIEPPLGRRAPAAAKAEAAPPGKKGRANGAASPGGDRPVQAASESGAGQVPSEELAGEIPRRS